MCAKRAKRGFHAAQTARGIRSRSGALQGPKNSRLRSPSQGDPTSRIKGDVSSLCGLLALSTGSTSVLTGTDRINQICCRADAATWCIVLCSPPRRDSHAALLGVDVGLKKVVQQVHSHDGHVSSECGSASALNGLDLLDSPGGPAEAGRELVAVEEEALASLDRRQSSARGTANTTLRGAGPGLLERAVLLGALAILREGVGREVAGEGLAGAGRVGLGGVVDGGCCVGITRSARGLGGICLHAEAECGRRGAETSTGR